jgi:branched-chain amino acid aminotransferase
MILVNGMFYPGSEAPFDLSDRGLTLADGLFETMLAVNGRVFLLDAHLDRLMAGLVEIGIPMTRARLTADVAAMLERLSLEPAALRLTVTRGGGARGLAIPVEPKPTILISAGPFNPGLVFTPARLTTASIRRNPLSPLSRLKSLSYLDNILALREAEENGASDALILNSEGKVACTTVANIFCVSGGVIMTPPVSDGILPGIMRARVPGLIEKSLTLADLISADTVFLTNSLRLVQPVTEIDGHVIADDGTAHRILDLFKAEINALTPK